MVYVHTEDSGRSFVDSKQDTVSKQVVLQGAGGNVAGGCQDPTNIVEVDAPVLTLKDTGTTTASSLYMQENTGTTLASIVPQQDSTPGKGGFVKKPCV